MKIGVYLGTFDPVTLGHIDIIRRTHNLFDKLYVVVPNNVNKKILFSVEERMNLLKEVVKEFKNVEVCSTDKLTVEFAKSVGASVMVRGLRMVSDFEYELQLATINKQLDNDIETIFIMSSHEYSYLSSSMVREIASFGGDVSDFVSPNVKEALIKKIKEN